MKNSTKHFLLILFVLSLLYSNSIAQCPAYNDLLNQGWLFVPNTNHLATTGNNEDEFGVIDTSPFFIKVNNYPPIRAFPKTYNDCTPEDIYYMSFDTDGQYQPIPFDVPFHNSNIVNIFREDGTGYTASVRPPTNLDVSASADFIMNFNTTEYDMAWDPYDPNYPNNINWEWTDFVTNSMPQLFTFHGVIEGPNELNGGQSATYIANIYGGNGNYGFKWEYSYDQGNTWILSKNNPRAIDWIYFYGNTNDPYYYYQDEYKLNITMQTNSILLKCTVTDSNYYQGIYDTIVLYKTITPAPVQITFINEIENTTNFGELILDEDKEVPIQSGVPKSMNYSTTYHTIRTDELPFIYNFNGTNKTEKHHYFELGSPSNLDYVLNHSFQVTLNTPSIIKSKFISTDPVKIKNLLDGVEVSGSVLNFKDPWYYYHDSYNNWFQSDEFKQYSSPLNLLNNSASSYGGVFLNQPYTGTNPFYSVKVDLEQQVLLGGQYHTFYFKNWDYSQDSISLENSNSNQTGIVFKTQNAELRAILKGIETTNSPTAYTNTSQCKFLKTPNGYLHNVYESLGDVWYEKSTNGGLTWQIMNNGNPINPYPEYGEAKSPSIACSNDGNDLIYITYQSTISDEPFGPFVMLTQYKNGILNWHRVVYALTDYPFTTDYQQVVAADNNVVMVIFNPPSPTTPEFIAKEYNIGGSPYFNVTQETARTLPYINALSSFPSITFGDDHYYHLVYQQGETTIKYLKWGVGSNPSTFNYYSTPSLSSGFVHNTNPTISYANVNPVVSWKGSQTNGQRQAVLRRGALSGSSIVWSDFLKVGSSVNYVYRDI